MNLDNLSVDTIVALVGNLGFPIFVAGWLLFRTDRALRELRDLVRELINIQRASPR